MVSPAVDVDEIADPPRNAGIVHDAAGLCRKALSARANNCSAKSALAMSPCAATTFARVELRLSRPALEQARGIAVRQVAEGDFSIRGVTARRTMAAPILQLPPVTTRTFRCVVMMREY